MKSGRRKGGFSKPRLPCKYFLFAHQCLGTGTVFRYAFRKANKSGSLAQTSHISMTSGRATICLSAATLGRLRRFSFFLLSVSTPLDPESKPPAEPTLDCEPLFDSGS
ncbi:unnamed protein product [Schistosoma curassoni]|uniref:Secreted protein n=1 Tax=Schistosoma curassoni TaxID=6186 RepID=A0A183KTI4_9TREM|nr:unnamed protein product [Schistosoma curassoni]